MKNLFPFLIIASIALASGVKGKWSGYMKLPNKDSVLMVYQFKVDGNSLSGFMQGPKGTQLITSGTIKDSILSFQVSGGNQEGNVYQTGKFYGDSITIDINANGIKLHNTLKRTK